METDNEDASSKKRYRLEGGGPPKRALELHSSLFEYFIDVRSVFKGRLPIK